MAGEETRVRRRLGIKGMTVGGMLTLAVLPLILLVLIFGGVLIWRLVVSDTAAGFSSIDLLAIAIGVLVVVAIDQSLRFVRVRSFYLGERIGELSQIAQRIARHDLAILTKSLSHPHPSIAPIAPIELTTEAPLELVELSESLLELHTSLEKVAERQMVTLKGGVSSLIVALARRSATLVDRQLAVLDELELVEEDPTVLGTYYMVDHYATRIRRNAESLLVLAGEPPPRVWPRSMEISDVVRAAVGEVDAYQRVEIASLERAQVAGGAVADLAHLLAELLDNATQYSPPNSQVTIRSVLDWDGYRLTISDRGPGLTNQRIADLNRVLKEPPALGTVMEATMGMYVVSKLAARHGIAIEIIPGIPGLTVQITIPGEILEVNLAEPATYETNYRRPHPDDPPRGRTTTRERVVDLTDPSFTEQGDRLEAEPIVPVEIPDKPADGLPMRSPGQTLGETMTSSNSVAEAESAIGIRAALAAYDMGRRAAAPASGQKEDNTEEDS